MEKLEGQLRVLIRSRDHAVRNKTIVRLEHVNLSTEEIVRILEERIITTNSALRKAEFDFKQL